MDGGARVDGGASQTSRCRHSARMRPPPSHRRPSRSAARPALPERPIDHEGAAALGWTRAALRHALAAGDVVSGGRGVVLGLAGAAPGSPNRRQVERALLDAARASAVRCPRAVISHFPAAVATGMPTVGALSRPCLSVPAGTALRHLVGAHLHRATLPERDLVHAQGDLVTSPARTIMDIAREHGVRAGVVAADYALHEGLVSRGDLADAYEACARWPGRRSARITLLSADGAAESPLESLSRMQFAAAGLPAPLPQAEICSISGEYITRSDFLWDEFGVVGEADGNAKYGPDGRVAVRERETRAKLERAGLIVVQWGWRDLRDFRPVLDRLQLAFARGVRPGSKSRQWGILLPTRLHP
ncbi:MAG: hypothetical protein QOH89_3325 [Pseudonocardiales bacterium]|nr:hypothetical protein [Pseudonocardiales bacterium]